MTRLHAPPLPLRPFSRRPWCLLPVLIAVLAALATPGRAWAHADLVHADPPANSVLVAAPSAIVLRFSEPVQPVADSFILLAPSGRHLPIAVRVRGAALSLPFRAHETGTYLLLWRVISDDTHPVAGELLFSVGHATAPPWLSAAVSSGDGGVPAAAILLQAAARWLHLLGYALGFGPPIFLLAVMGPVGIGAEGDAARRLWRLVTAGILALVLAEPFSLLALTAALGTGGLYDPAIISVALSSNVGRVLAQRLGAAALLWMLAGAAAGGSRSALRAVPLLALALALIDGQSTHAGDGGVPVFSYAIGAVHQVAMGLWVGGLASLLAVWKVQELVPARAALVGRFGWMAAASLLVLALTGLAMAWQHLAALGSLTRTGYGRALSAKVLALPAVLGSAVAGARTWRRRGRRLWLLEAGGLLLLLGAAALMVSLPPG